MATAQSFRHARSTRPRMHVFIYGSCSRMPYDLPLILYYEASSPGMPPEEVSFASCIHAWLLCAYNHTCPVQVETSRRPNQKFKVLAATCKYQACAHDVSYVSWHCIVYTSNQRGLARHKSHRRMTRMTIAQKTWCTASWIPTT